MTAKLGFTFLDHDGEASVVEFEINDVTDLNFTDVTDGGTGARDDIQAALAGLTAGTYSKFKALVKDEAISDALPADPWAQVETGIRVYGRGDNGRLYTRTIPTADLTAVQFVAGQKGALVLADGGAMAALVTALESHWEPEDGVSVTIEKAVHIGRNR